MDIGLKRRLITAIIILALIVIFVPMLFKQHKSSHATHVVITTPAMPPSQPQVDQQQQPVEQQTQPQVNQPQPVKQQTQSQVVQPQQTNAQQTTEQQATQPAEQPIKQQTEQPTQSPVVQHQQTNVEQPKNQFSTMPTVKPKPKITQTAIKVIKIKPKFTPAVLPHKIKPRLTPKPKLKPNAKAYVVRLGVFANDENATKLIHKLRDKGFTSFGYKYKKRGNKILTHVYVGPLVTRKHAEQTVQQLKKIMKLKGVVTPFDATKLY
ncbi:MAG: SPOR domain-containing protein [Gammaproteobacteria bacterium]|jgi:cell division septation protein DedD